MSYQVIARKYRPQRFADVVGQEHVTQTLANAIRQNRIAHAYLFVGPRGTGKTTLARIFAMCLNCTGGPKVDFAQDDPRCQEIAEGRSLDVLEIDGASNRGIEEVRELRETVKYAPATGRFKIYIIDEVHMLTKEAFNALLKTLEEPPPHVKFMFATTEPEKVLPTILSRCQRFDLRRIPTPLIVKHLAEIARLENVTIDEPALHAVARGAEGGMRDAQSALDQLISFCGTEIVEPDVLSMFGLASRAQVVALAEAIMAGEAQAALRLVDDLAKKGKDVGRLLSELLNYFRNLLLFQVSQGDTSLLDVSESEMATLSKQSGILTLETLTRMMDLLSQYEGRLREAASKRILIEVAVLNTIQARKAISIDSVLEKLQSARGTPGGSPAPASAPPTMAAPVSAAPASPPAAAAAAPVTARVAATPPPAPSTPAPHQAGPAQPPSGGAISLRELWAKVVDLAGRASLFVKSYLLEAHPVSLTKNVLTIGFDPQFSDHLGLVDNPKNRTLIESKLRELGYADVQVRFVEAVAPPDWTRLPDPAGTVPAAAAPVAEPEKTKPLVASAPTHNAASAQAKVTPAARPNKESFKDDPLIKQALELFKGRIVEVRA
jgi:DNA polymerase III subunit gamma/tau